MEDKTITVDEIKNQVIAELQANAMADIKAKADEEAKENALREKIREEMKTELAKTVNAPPEANKKIEGAPAHIKGGKKMDLQSEELYDALKSAKGSRETTIELEMDVNGVESNLLEAEKIDSSNNQSKLVDGIKANLDGATSYGSEFVPQEWASNFYMRMATLDGDLMNYFPKVGMNTNTKNIAELLTYPTISARYAYAGANTAVEDITATDVTTADQQLNARKLAAKINVYYDLLEDDKFGLMRGIKSMVSSELGSQVSNGLLNGDSTLPHMDEDTEAAAASSNNHPLKLYKGLRKLTLAGSLGVDGAATYTLTNLKAVRSKMGKYALGKNKKNCIWIMGIATSSQLDGLLEASQSTPQAADFVVKEGQIIRYLGYPIIISEHQREDLEIDGYYDESGTAASQGFASLVNTSQFLLGIRKKMMIRIVDIPEDEKKQVTATMRYDFKPFETPSTTVSSLAGMYAYTL